jgi:prevent-host-death family protein
MKKVALAEVKDHLSEYLRDATEEEVVITRHGRPAGVLIGFRDDDDWFDFRLENDPAFLARIARARASLRAGKGIPWEDVQAGSEATPVAFVASDKPSTRKKRAGR